MLAPRRAKYISLLDLLNRSALPDVFNLKKILNKVAILSGGKNVGTP